MPEDAERSLKALGPAHQRGRASAARPLPRSIFLGEHDGENAHRLCGIGEVFGAELTGGGVVVVDLPENALGVVIDPPEIMLPVRVVVGREGVERPHLLEDRVAVELRRRLT